MTDPAEIRAEGRRLLANVATLPPGVDPRIYLGRFLRDHADVLLADPAPEPRLTKDEAAVVKKALDRLSAAPRAEREALERIAHLCESMATAYPEDIFLPVPEDKKAKDALAADVLREVACPQFAAAATIARDALAAPAEERFPNGYPEDPVLGPYEDDAD